MDRDAIDAIDDVGGRAGRRVALVSSARFAHLDDDLPPLVAALARRDVNAVVVDWNDDAVDWAAVDLAVIRSTWDYTWHLDEFLAWVDRVGAATRLANPGPVVRWNADKRYLLDLAGLGVPTVSTTVVGPGDDPSAALPRAAEQLVVKPAVSAGARDTERYGPGELVGAREHVVRLQAEGRSVLVQPYLPEIDERGETGLVFVGDEFSHAFRKGPILRPGSVFVEDLYREEHISPRVPSGGEHEVAAAALDAVASCVPGWSRRDLLYARVDVAPCDGGYVVLELELVEPSLFCSTDPRAADRAAVAFAAASGG
jgi:glutathione synthase/RimK-type ligase-like ATP-grasp enzyme